MKTCLSNQGYFYSESELDDTSDEVAEAELLCKKSHDQSAMKHTQKGSFEEELSETSDEGMESSDNDNSMDTLKTVQTESRKEGSDNRQFDVVLPITQHRNSITSNSRSELHPGRLCFTTPSASKKVPPSTS